jgi:hypothetical protein
MNKQKGAVMFKTIASGFGAICLFVGIIMMAGSAGDCDGACMEQANTMSEMLTIAGTGLIFALAGAWFVAVGQSE